MKYKTLFRVLLKLIGVWLFAQGVVSMMGLIPNLLLYFDRGSPPGSWWYMVPARGVTGMALGAYLFFGGRWIADKAIPSNRPYCHECGYDLSTSARDKCPECGTPVGRNQRDS